MNKHTAILGTVLVIVSALPRMLDISYGDEVWLLLGLIAVQIAYLVRADSRQGYLSYTLPLVLLILGGYLIALKTPRLLAERMNYTIAQLLCLAFYAIGGWFLLRRATRYPKTQ